jgi:hypothetical protein
VFGFIHVKKAAYVAVIHPAEHLSLHAAPGICVLQGPIGFCDVNPLHFHFAGDIEYRVQEHVIPALEPVLDPRLELATARNPLNDVGDVHHREHVATACYEVGGRNLSRQSELLLVPDNVVVEKDILREFTRKQRLGMNDYFPHLVRRYVTAHPARDLEAVRSALWKAPDCVRKEESLPESFANEFAAPLASDYTKGFFH